MRIVTGIFLLVFAGLLWASDDIDQDEARSLRDAGTILPLEDILAASRKLRPGRVMEVELEKKHGKYVYEIEIADDKGIVWEMKFNAQDATLISQEQDD